MRKRLEINRNTLAVCYLRITTWVGSSVGYAEHWYGKLISGPKKDWKDDGNEVELRYTLTPDEAAALNRSEGYDDSSLSLLASYKTGEESGRFLSKERLIDEAAAQYRKHFSKARLLIEGDPITLEPQPILDGPPEIAARINTLWYECEELGWWDAGEEAEAACEERCDEWRQIWKDQIEPLTRQRTATEEEESMILACQHCGGLEAVIIACMAAAWGWGAYLLARVFGRLRPPKGQE